ncbi:diacylglycerol O-acyltransferase 1-like [Rhincodon typus]|uniref:diacylglycerol O-acyltransferase 1-like n=1 Tax=Rhincodon typus TaxID=259920 RepID=UPI00202F917B|nr:diacylglycerol O-acyltransferase 1-like [Rhincodon typus]
MASHSEVRDTSPKLRRKSTPRFSNIHIKSRTIERSKFYEDLVEEMRRKMCCHKVRESLLSSSSGFLNYRGILNWAVVVLILTHAHMVLENLITYGLLVDPVQIIAFALSDPNTWPGSYLIIVSNVFVLVALHIERSLSVIFLIHLFIGLIQQWVLPVTRNAMQPFVEMSLTMMIHQLLLIAIPNHFMWLIFFHGFFHSTLNFIAELMRFGDRRFYRDWWTKTQRFICTFVQIRELGARTQAQGERVTRATTWRLYVQPWKQAARVRRSIADGSEFSWRQ